jgi:hypothetical protein
MLEAGAALGLKDEVVHDGVLLLDRTLSSVQQVGAGQVVVTQGVYACACVVCAQGGNVCLCACMSMPARLPM